MKKPYCPLLSGDHRDHAKHPGYRHAETLQDALDAVAAGDCYDIDGDKTHLVQKAADGEYLDIYYEGGSFREIPSYLLVPEVTITAEDEAEAIASIMEAMRE